MPCYCVVNGCKSSTDMNKEKNCKHIKFFYFPKNEKMRKLWIEACGNKNVNTNSGRICSMHFTDEDYRLKDILLEIPIEKRLLKPNSVPSIKMPEKIKLKTTQARENRAAHRESKKIVESALDNYDIRVLKIKEPNTSDVLHALMSIDNEVSPTTKTVAVQTEVDFNCEKELRIITMENKIKKLEMENQRMKNQIQQFANLENSIEKMFTSGQIQRLKNPNHRVNWTIDDIAASICLHSAGPRSYRYLIKHNHPLPAESTIRSWARKLDTKPGILHDVM